jgi:MarR family transcriptional regulator, 2-MHQ and catechol-resistance regulon repressor
MMSDFQEGATDDALKLWVVLSRARSAVARHSKADIQSHGMSEGEFAVLELLLHKQEPLLLGEIQRRILLSSGGITYIVDRLEKKGLVERRRCEDDRRAIYAALTDEGEAKIRSIFPQHARAIAHAVSGLSRAEQAQAIDLLRRLGRDAAARAERDSRYRIREEGDEGEQEPPPNGRP